MLQDDVDFDFFLNPVEELGEMPWPPIDNPDLQCAVGGSQKKVENPVDTRGTQAAY